MSRKVKFSGRFHAQKVSKEGKVLVEGLGFNQELKGKFYKKDLVLPKKERFRKMF